MQFHFGADVRPHDDAGDLGDLRRLVYDPGTGQVASIVVELGDLEGREVLVPIGAVASSDDDAVYVVLSADQMDRMPAFATERNVAPPPVLENEIPDQIKEPVDVPDVPPVGAATGIESIAYTPIIQEAIRVPADDRVVDGDTTVWATDGEVGRVTQVITDDQTNRIQSFIVERGAVFTDDTEIGIDMVADIETGTIVLRVDRATLEGAQRGV